ncbi:MAG: hypothetical protein CME06_12815 [Gemmatimonadetes bacterium]|nr:hypothetical protein [Gemmatimonadota bacterium]
MKALHALCPAPERLVEYVLDGPTDEITTHIEDCAECSREVIDIFKRFDQFNALERKGEGDTLPTGLWESLHAEHKTPRPPVVLSLRLHPKPSFVGGEGEGEGAELRAAAGGGLRGGGKESAVAELTTNGGLRLVFVIVDGMLSVRALRDGAPEEGVRLSLGEVSGEGAEGEGESGSGRTIALTISTDEAGQARVELAPFAECEGLGIRLEPTT